MDPIQAMLAAGVVPSDDLPPTSRYRDVGTTTYGQGPDAVHHYRRRLVPDPDRHPLIKQVQVRDSDRRDTVAHAHLLDAYLWWRLADANGVLDPRELEQPAGRWLLVTGPAAPPGQPPAAAEDRDA